MDRNFLKVFSRKERQKLEKKEDIIIQEMRRKEWALETLRTKQRVGGTSRKKKW